MIVKIKRQHAPETDAYWQSFVYSGPEHVTVSAVLDALNYTDDLFDADGTFRVYGFTQTTDRYDENQGEQEGGIGLSINASFNTLNELWTNIVGSKEVRMERRTERRAHKDSLKRAHTEPRNVELQDTTRRIDSLINTEMIEIEEKEIDKGSSKMRELSVDSDRMELPNEDQD